MKKKAIIIGATGLVGTQLVKHLSFIYDNIIVIARTPPKLMCPSMHFYQLSDFGQLEDTMNNLSFDADTDAFTCLGTTKKQAGSEEAFWRIDYEYNNNFARLCHEKGVQQFFLLSARGADSDSRFFYNQVKGKLEASIKEIGFKRLLIFRPSLLLGHHKGRPLETIAQKAYKIVSPIVPKSLSARPISAKRVAAAMTMTAQNLHERNKFASHNGDDNRRPKTIVVENKQMLSMTRLN